MLAASVAGGALQGGLGLLAGDAQAGAAGDALAAQTALGQQALKFQKKVYKQARADTAPYREVGVNALNRLSDVFLGTSDTSRRLADLRSQLDKAESPGTRTVTKTVRTQPAVSRSAMGLGRGRGGDAFARGAGGMRTITRQVPMSVNEDRVNRLRDEIEALEAEDTGAYPDYSEFYKSPSYTFRLDEGIRALDRSAAARGGLRGGGYGRDLTRYAQGLASTEFNNYANRLASLAGVGQSAVGQAASAGASAAGQYGNTSLGLGAQMGNAMNLMGAARASGYAGAANAIGGGVENIAFLNRLKRPSPTLTSPTVTI